MTEDKARTKWCPMVRLTGRSDGYISAAFNRWFGRIDRQDTEPTKEVFNCIASKCMMWKPDISEKIITTAGYPPEGDGWIKKGPPGNRGGDRISQEWVRSNTSGKCGLTK